MSLPVYLHTTIIHTINFFKMAFKGIISQQRHIVMILFYH
jgi:hypothetical protein